MNTVILAIDLKTDYGIFIDKSYIIH